MRSRRRQEHCSGPPPHPSLTPSPSAHLGWRRSPWALPGPWRVLQLLVAATAASLPALEELPSQGAEQKLLTDGPPWTHGVGPSASPRAECILAVTLQRGAAQGLGSPVGESLSLAPTHTCLSPSSRSRGADPWQVEPACAHGGWKETDVPCQPVRPSVHPVSELAGTSCFSALTLTPIGLLEGDSQRVVWGPLCLNPLHRHTGLLSGGGTWESASAASFLQVIPLSTGVWKPASLWSNVKGALFIWGSQCLMRTEKTCL